MAVMKAIIDALNVVYDEKEKRGFIKLNGSRWRLQSGVLSEFCSRSGSSLLHRSSSRWLD
jgi:hypothetical protein